MNLEKNTQPNNLDFTDNSEIGIDENEPASVELEAQRIKKCLGLSDEFLKGKAILDLASGDSHLSEYYKGNNDINIISFDINIPKTLKTEKFVQGDASNLPFKNESLDLIISLGGPLGISVNKADNIKMLQEIKRVLKDGGEVRLGTGWFHASIFEAPNHDLLLEDRKRYFRQQSKKFIEELGFSKVEEISLSAEAVDDNSSPNFYYKITK